jgi:hypothetical protein
MTSRFLPAQWFGYMPVANHQEDEKSEEDILPVRRMVARRPWNHAIVILSFANLLLFALNAALTLNLGNIFDKKPMNAELRAASSYSKFLFHGAVFSTHSQKRPHASDDTKE